MNVIRKGQPQVVHQINVLFSASACDTRIETLFLTDGGTGVASVVVGRKHQGLVGKRKELLRNGVELFPGIAFREVTAAGAANKQSVAGQHAVFCK